MILLTCILMIKNMCLKLKKTINVFFLNAINKRVFRCFKTSNIKNTIQKNLRCLKK